MEKIKILRIITRLNIGGPAIHVILLTQGLNKAQFDTMLVSGSVGRDEGDMSYYASERNIKPYFIPELKRGPDLINDFICLIKIYNVIRRYKPDIIHTHTAKAGALGRTAAILYNFANPFMRKKIKLVHTFHGHVFEGYFSSSKARLIIFIERILGYFTSNTLIVSDSLKNEIVKRGVSSEKKVSVMPLGLELQKFMDIPERNDKDFNIGIVGRLVPIKNHRLFLDAARIIIKDNPELKIRFKIIGDGELRKELEDYSRRINIGGFVDFLGWQKDLVPIYSMLDIVALTSINEGTPVSLIEAMASGRAIVTTDAGGVGDILGKAVESVVNSKKDFKPLERGLMVKPGNAAGFASALAFLLNDAGLRQSMGSCAREFAKNMFSKERLISDMQKSYLSLLQKRK